MVIPFKFSNEPRAFHNGLAYVKAKDPSEFWVAYIDKTGEPKIKMKANPLQEDFDMGYIMFQKQNGDISLMDTEGHSTDFPKKAMFNGKEYSFQLEIHSVNQGVIPIGGPGGHGLVSVKGEIIVPPVFWVVGGYDPVSKLTLVSFKKPDGKVVQGYVNEKAVFVIIKAPPSTF